MNLVKAADTWLFGFGSPITMAMFRIVFGIVILVNLFFLLPFWGDFFSEKGFVPNAVSVLWMGEGVAIPELGGLKIPRINLLSTALSDPLQMAFYLATIVACLFTIAGLFTRISSIALAIGIITLHHRNPIILHGGDTVLRVMAMYIALAPSGAALSLDKIRQNLKAGQALPLAAVSLWPQRLMALNVGLIYFTTIWQKTFGEYWRNGTATWYTARLEEFKRFPVPPFVNEFPMVTITTYGTLLIEFALGTLVFSRFFRNPILIAGLAMHLYIEYSMNIPLFALVICSTYLVFFEGEELSSFFASRQQKWNLPKLEIGPPNGNVWTENSKAWVRSFDLFGTLVPVNEARPSSLNLKHLWWRAPFLWIFNRTKGWTTAFGEATLLETKK